MGQLDSEEELRKAGRAQALLTELKPILDELVAEAFEEWRKSKEPAARDVIWQRVQGFDGVEDALRIRIERGKFATAAVDTQSRRS